MFAYFPTISVFSASGLGPEAGVNATDNATTNLAGVSVNIGGVPAILLYVPDRQINFAAPLVVYGKTWAPIQVTVNDLSSQPRQLQLTYANPHLFIDGAATYDPTNLNRRFVPLTLNADGSVNSPSNPAQAGSTVSASVNGLTPNPQVTNGRCNFTRRVSGGWWTSRGKRRSATAVVPQATAVVPHSAVVADGSSHGVLAGVFAVVLFSIWNPVRARVRRAPGFAGARLTWDRPSGS